jgi:hypothetical protein
MEHMKLEDVIVVVKQEVETLEIEEKTVTR